MKEDNYKKSWWQRVVRHIGTALSVLLIVFAVGVLAAVVPVFGNRGLIVRSGSMEPAVGVGDLVVVRAKATGYQKGDVIAFRSDGKENMVVTHRITEVERVGDNISYTTQGDANNQADSNKVKPEYIIGSQVFTIPYLGRLLAFGKTKGGYMSFILIPALIVIASELRVIVRELSKKKKTIGVTVPAVPVIKRKQLVLNESSEIKKKKKFVPVSAQQYGRASIITSERFFNLPPMPFKRRAIVPVDSITERLVVNTVKQVMVITVLAIMIPSTFAIYADTEKSVGNMFVAAACFDGDLCPSPSFVVSSSPSPSLLPSPSLSSTPSPSVGPSPSPSPSASPTATSVGAGDVVINEVMWMGSTVQSGDEWIELRNLTNSEVSVEEWTIDSAGIGSDEIELAGSIPANGYYLLSNFESDHIQSALKDSISVDKAINLSLLNDGEQLVLRDAVDTIIDSTPVEAWPAGVNTTGENPLKQSMARNDSPENGTVAGNWHTCTDLACNDTTWWDVEDDNYGTPGGANL